jgi:hypothetical protein
MRTVDDYAKYRLAHRDGRTIRRIARTFHVSRHTVREALASPEPQPYTRTKPPPLPVLGPFTALVDQILRDDRDAPPKQRHTAAQIYCHRSPYRGPDRERSAWFPPIGKVVVRLRAVELTQSSHRGARGHEPPQFTSFRACDLTAGDATAAGLAPTHRSSSGPPSGEPGVLHRAAGSRPPPVCLLGSEITGPVRAPRS